MENYFKQADSTILTMVAATYPPYIQKWVERHFSIETDPKPNKPTLNKIIDRKTHTNLTNIAHEFLKLPEFDKNPTLLNVLESIDS